MANTRHQAASSSRAGLRVCAALAASVVVLHGAPAAAEPMMNNRDSEIEIRLLGFGGLNGALDPPVGAGAVVRQADGSTVQAGGATYLAAYLNQLRQQAANSVLLSVGDNAGAPPAPSGVLQDEPVVELLNSWGVDATAVGPGDLAGGSEELLRLQGGGCHPATGCAFRPEFPGASFPMLAANISNSDGKPFTLPFAIRHIGNVPVGVIGVTVSEDAAALPPGTVDGLRFGDEVEAVDRTAESLEFFGVKAMVLLVRADTADVGQAGPNDCAPGESAVRQVAANVTSRVDVVFSGGGGDPFTCTVRDPAGNERPLVHAASLGRTVAVADIVVDPASGDVVRDRTSAFNQVVTRDIPADAATQGLVDEVARRTQEFSAQRLGEITAEATRGASPRGESTLGHVVADAQLAATRPEGAQLAFADPRSLAADLEAGPVTYGEVLAVHPANRYLHTVELTGQQLYGLLEEQFRDGGEVLLQPSSNVTYRIDPAREPGMRVADLRVDGKLVDKAARYTVSADAHLAAGGGGFPTLGGAASSRTRSTDVQALVSYVLANDPLTPPPTDRVDGP